MRSIKPIQTAKVGTIVLSSLFCLLGILMLALPELSVSLIGLLLGILMIVFGIVKLIGYFSKDLYRLAFQHDLAMGLLLCVLGTLVLCNPNHAAGFLCLILGIGIAADGLLKIQTAFDARRFGLHSWCLILVSGIAAGVIGIATAFRPIQSARVLMILLGVCMLAEGILNLIVAICAIKIVRNQQPDVIETHFYEE